jgi:hypothetical protein
VSTPRDVFLQVIADIERNAAARERNRIVGVIRGLSLESYDFALNEFRELILTAIAEAAEPESQSGPSSAVSATVAGIEPGTEAGTQSVPGLDARATSTPRGDTE